MAASHTLWSIIEFNRVLIAITLVISYQSTKRSKLIWLPRHVTEHATDVCLAHPLKMILYRARPIELSQRASISDPFYWLFVCSRETHKTMRIFEVLTYHGSLSLSSSGKLNEFKFKNFTQTDSCLHLSGADFFGRHLKSAWDFDFSRF